MTLPVGRNGSSGSRTGVLDTLCCRGKELLQSLSVCSCAFVFSICVSVRVLQHVSMFSVNLELHIGLTEVW